MRGLRAGAAIVAAVMAIGSGTARAGEGDAARVEREIARTVYDYYLLADATNPTSPARP